MINCNLQRLDGPVRGNGKIIQELEGVFRGAGWNVIKVIWGRKWDPLLEKDETGLLQQRMDEVCDGELQNYKYNGGAYTREHFFGKYPELLELVQICPTTTSCTSIAAVTTRTRSMRPMPRRSSSMSAHGDPGHDGEGLWHGRGRGGQQRNPLTEETGYGQPEGLPRPLRHPDQRRGAEGRALLPARAGQPGDALHAAASR